MKLPNLYILRVMVLNEFRLRSRRASTVVVLLAAIALAWAMIPDPRFGHTLLAISDARVLYDSTTLSLGSASLISLVFSLAGFYLVRGRMREDLRDGTGSVVASTMVSNGSFLFGRWLGAVAYLTILMLVVMLTVLMLHAVRGEGAINVFIYLQMYFLLLLPSVMFAAGMALLADSYGPLMGKGGDIVYFLIWVAQFALLPLTLSKEGASRWLAYDYFGIATGMSRLQQMYPDGDVSLGGTPFDAALAPLVLGHDFWTGEMLGNRFLAAAGTLLLLPVAILLFHRYSPDRVSARSSRKRGSPLAWLNQILRPLAAPVRPLFTMSARLPGLAGSALADLALTLSLNPVALLALAGCVVAGFIAPADALSKVVVAAILCWGVISCDISTRDFQADTEQFGASVPGGATRRFTSQLLSTMLLGGLFVAVPVVRRLPAAPFSALALIAGMLMLSAAASMLGRTSRSSRTFLALFLFAMYVSLQVKGDAYFDIIGATGAANTASITMELAAAAAMCVAGYWVSWRAAR
jgi:hypothetical protein